MIVILSCPTPSPKKFLLAREDKGRWSNPEEPVQFYSVHHIALSIILALFEVEHYGNMLLKLLGNFPSSLIILLLVISRKPAHKSEN